MENKNVDNKKFDIMIFTTTRGQVYQTLHNSFSQKSLETKKAA
jgi:hypothetical protein